MMRNWVYYLNPQPWMQQPPVELSSQIGHIGPILYKKKKGSQHAMKLPIINPRISVARRSFFLAILLRSFSASCILKIVISYTYLSYILNKLLFWLTIVWKILSQCVIKMRITRTICFDYCSSACFFRRRAIDHW